MVSIAQSTHINTKYNQSVGCSVNENEWERSCRVEKWIRVRFVLCIGGVPLALPAILQMRLFFSGRVHIFAKESLGRCERLRSLLGLILA